MLVSSLPPAAIAPTYARWAPDLATALARSDDILVVPEASKRVNQAVP